MTVESANADKKLHASEGWVKATTAYGGPFESATVEYRESSGGARSILLYGQTEPVDGQSRGIAIDFYNSIEPGVYPLPSNAFPNDYHCRYFTQNGDHRTSYEAVDGTLTISSFDRVQTFATGFFSFSAYVDEASHSFGGEFDIRWIEDEKK